MRFVDLYHLAHTIYHGSYIRWMHISLRVCMVQIVLFRFVESIWLHQKVSKIRFFFSEKKYNTSDMYELPSYIITMMETRKIREGCLLFLKQQYWKCQRMKIGGGGKRYQLWGTIYIYEYFVDIFCLGNLLWLGRFYFSK